VLGICEGKGKMDRTSTGPGQLLDIIHILSHKTCADIFMSIV